MECVYVLCIGVVLEIVLCVSGDVGTVLESGLTIVRE